MQIIEKECVLPLLKCSMFRRSSKGFSKQTRVVGTRARTPDLHSVDRLALRARVYSMGQSY